MADLIQLPHPEVLETLRRLAQGNPSIYLVGGAVRDTLLNRTTNDLDFVMEKDVRPLAKSLASKLSGDFYMLDDERNTARVILGGADGNKVILDFATLRAETLDGDLQGRDFTINAMALPLEDPRRLIDPLDGAKDLLSRTLRTCSPDAFVDDPVRILRAVRLSQSLEFPIEKATLKGMQAAAALLPRVSNERIRDELFKILEEKRCSAAVRVLDHLGILSIILPELSKMKGIQQTSPHLLDVWEHTLSTLTELEHIFDLMVNKIPGKSADSLSMGSTMLLLGKFRPNLRAHYDQALNPNRSLRALLFYAALYHDAGKPDTFQQENNSRIRFIGHEIDSTKMAAERARKLALSQVEIQRIEAVINNHMRIHALAHPDNLPSHRAIYRFFKAVGAGGVDICLLSLADTLATYGVTLTPEQWNMELEVCRVLLEAWWEKPQEVITPQRLLTGDDLLQIFKLQPGPLIGELLEVIRESQAAGEIKTRDDAIIYARNRLRRSK